MKNCPQHGQLLDQYKFCPFCGWQLDDNARRTDFELGRIEALNTIKQEISAWFTHWFSIIASVTTICGVIIAILGLFGFNELINNRVEKSVNNSVEKLEKLIREKVDSSVEKSVREEIGRIHYSLRYLVDIFPIIESDFFRIKNVKSTIKITYNEKINDILGTGWRVPSVVLSSRLISDSNSFDFISRTIETKVEELSADSDFLYHENAFAYLINEQIDIFHTFKYLEIKFSVNFDTSKYAPQYFESILYEFSAQLDRYVDSIDEMKIETDVNKVKLYGFTIMRNDLKKTDKLEYTYTKYLKEIFNDIESIRNHYIGIVDMKRKKY